MGFFCSPLQQILLLIDEGTGSEIHQLEMFPFVLQGG